jgi:uncharacterized membrane protein YheB (UPF0754 family)
MAVHWFSLLSKSITGGIVGYYTNDLAIDMLFRKRFGLGGIVLKTHHEFVENISRLVEEDIITHHAIGAAFDTPQFRAELQKTVEQLLTEEIPAWIAHTPRLNEVPDLAIAVEHILFDLEPAIELALKRIFPAVSRHLELSTLISERQVKHVGGQLAGILRRILAKHETDTEWLHYVFTSSPNGILHAPLEQVIQKDIVAEWIAILRQPLLFVPAELRYNFSAPLRDSLQSAVHTLLPPKTVETLVYRLGEERLSDYISEAEFAGMFHVFREKVRGLLQEPAGKRILETFLKLLYEQLLKVDTTLFELLDKNMGAHFKDFLLQRLPGVLEKLIAFIQNEKHLIDELIDETFRRNTQTLLQEWLIDLFVGSVSAETKVVDKIIHYLETYDAQTLAQEGANYLLDYLQKNSIGSIVAHIPKHRFVEVLLPSIQKGITDEIDKLKAKQLYVYLNEPLRKWLPLKKLAPQISRRISESLPQQIYTFLTDEKFEPAWQKLIERLSVNQLLGKPLIEILDEHQQGQLIQDLARWWYKSIHSPQLAFDIEQALYAEVKKRNLETLIPTQQWLQWLPSLSRQATALLRTEYEKIAGQPLLPFYNRIQKNEKVVDTLTERTKQVLVNNAEVLLKGRIEELVRNNLSKLPPERIRDMVEEFMGKEVKPITRLGALLGGIAGAGLYALPALPGWGANLALSGAAYGITGYGTNWLALKMIFRPYRPYYIGKQRLPFTPGVIAKNQARFAENMGRFVGEQLLNQDKLVERFRENRTQLEEKAVQLIQKDDYRLLTQLIEENRPQLSQWLSESSLRLIDQHFGVLVRPLIKDTTERLGNTTLKEFDTSAIRSNILEYLQSERFTERLGRLAIRRLEQIGHWSEDDFKRLYTYLFPIFAQQFNHFINSRQLHEFLFNRWQAWHQKHQAASLHEIIQSFPDKDWLPTVSKQLIQTWMQTPRLAKRVTDILHARLQKEISPERPIESLLGGRLMVEVEHLLEHTLQDFMQKAIRWMQENKSRLAEDIYAKAKEENGMAVLYKRTIKDTVYELADDIIPAYLESRLPVFRQLLRQEIHQIGKLPIGELNTGIEHKRLSETVHSFLHNQEFLYIAGEIGSLSVVEVSKRIRLSELVQETSIEQITKWQAIFQWLTPPLTIDDKQQATLMQDFQWISRLLYRLYGRESLSIWIERLRIDKTLPALLVPLIRHPRIQKQQKLWVDEFFAVSKNKPLKDLLDTEQLRIDAQNTLHKLWHTEEFKHTLQESLTSIYDSLLEKLISNLPLETKAFLVKNLTHYAMNSLEVHLPALLQSINLRGIVVEEIKSMNPKEIEKLFQSFAGRYFRELINYGFSFGIVFGLLLDGILQAGLSLSH